MVEFLYESFFFLVLDTLNIYKSVNYTNKKTIEYNLDSTPSLTFNII